MSQGEELGELRAHIEHLREGQERIERQVAEGFASLRALLTPLDMRLGVVEREQAEGRGRRRALATVLLAIQGMVAAIVWHLWRARQ